MGHCSLYGKDTVRPRNFQVAVFVRLGVPVLAEIVVLCACKPSMFLATCTKNADLIHRHNGVRNLLGKICSEGALSPIFEKKGILGDSDKPGRRPGDVTIPLWSHGRGLDRRGRD